MEKNQPLSLKIDDLALRNRFLVLKNHSLALGNDFLVLGSYFIVQVCHSLELVCHFLVYGGFGLISFYLEWIGQLLEYSIESRKDRGKGWHQEKFPCLPISLLLY